jgi:hypothetical protein
MMFLLRCWFVGLLWFNGASAATTTYRVDGYASHTQSPFAEGISNGEILYTNFENSQWWSVEPEILPMPGVSMGTAFSYAYVPSVDEDDGLMDGFGRGNSLRTQTVAGSRPRFVFNFSPDAQGRYPRYFGIALPGSASDENGNFLETMGVKDAFGAVVLNYTFNTLRTTGNLGRPEVTSFIGVFSDAGISQVTMQNAAWLDHLQYGYSIPEPSLLWVPALTLCYRRRSHAQLARNRKHT